MFASPQNFGNCEHPRNRTTPTNRTRACPLEMNTGRGRTFNPRKFVAGCPFPRSNSRNPRREPAACHDCWTGRARGPGRLPYSGAMAIPRCPNPLLRGGVGRAIRSCSAESHGAVPRQSRRNLWRLGNHPRPCRDRPSKVASDSAPSMQDHERLSSEAGLLQKHVSEIPRPSPAAPPKHAHYPGDADQRRPRQSPISVVAFRWPIRVHRPRLT